VSRVVRLGAVSYLNVRPLVYGLGASSTGDGGPVALRFDVPSVCAALLATGEIDLGMVPSITWVDRPTDQIVPGICIGSVGPVASVALFTRRPLRDVRSIALDVSSRTSVVLTKILCARRYAISPSFVPHAPDLPSMLAMADAALLIGDPALFASPQAVGADKIDLGAEWAALTGLPFVWAFWAGHPEAVDAAVVRRLQVARDAGVADSDAVADAYCPGDPARQALARRYLRDHMHYAFDGPMQEGLATYYREAAALGLAPSAPTLAFFGSSAAPAGL
jgi:chorismate dehydratase